MLAGVGGLEDVPKLTQMLGGTSADVGGVEAELEAIGAVGG